MATADQILKLRTKIQDRYSKEDGSELTSDQFAFNDDELEGIIDDCFAEVTDGARSAEEGSTLDEALAMLLSRADAILQVAQDEARRIKWQINNQAHDPEAIAPNLVQIAKALTARYESYRKRELQAEIAGVSKPTTGGVMRFNSTVRSNQDRNFNNRTVNRNRSKDHY